jgi:N-acetylmuramoyl-L-alanine amidase
MNVRASPSLQAAILTTVPVGGLYRIFGWSGGWAHVQLPSGTIGWISGTVFGASSNSATPSYQSNTYRHTTRTTRRKASTQGGSVLTAGVRVHSRPGIKAPVVVVAAAGTHVTVLGYSGGWVLVRLPSGQTGYVLGTYVR